MDDQEREHSGYQFEGVVNIEVVGWLGEGIGGPKGYEMDKGVHVEEKRTVLWVAVL